MFILIGLLIFIVVGIINSILFDFEHLTLPEIIIWNIALIIALLSAILYKIFETQTKNTLNNNDE